MSEKSELSGDALDAFRKALPHVVDAWPEGMSFSDLSSARRRVVINAVERLADLLAGESEHPVAGAKNELRKKPSTKTERGDDVSREMEASVGVTLDHLSMLFALDGIKGFGPQKFKLLYDAGIDPESALRHPSELPLSGKTGDSLRHALSNVTPEDRHLAQQRAARQITVAHKNRAHILTYKHAQYPANVLGSNNPIPVLYARGDTSVLMEAKAVACVGSRMIREPYAHLQAEFAKYATSAGFVIVSGFAMGADTIAHRAAVEVGGRTVCVMPGGLDRPFPPENKRTFDEWLERPGVAFLGEFPFGTPTNAMNLRKRNKTIVACALGVLVGQSSVTGGAMNAFKFGLEQRKPVSTFDADGSDSTSGNNAIASSTKGVTASLARWESREGWSAWLSTLR